MRVSGMRQRSESALAIGCVVAGAISVAAYLLAGRLVAGKFGFPLDDAWIHQVVARNLAATGRPEFNAGEPALASSSPLWLVLLAAGYRLEAPPLLWTGSLAAAAAGFAAWAAWWLGRAAVPGRPGLALAAAALSVAEWRLAWLAASGMETALFSGLALLGVAMAVARRPWWQVGIPAALAAATRPEGLALAALLACWSVLPQQADEPRARRWLRAGAMLAPALMVAATLGLVAWRLTGYVLPATYYAKVSGYAQVRGVGDVWRYWLHVGQYLVSGPAVFVLPGLLWWPFARRARGPALRGGWLLAGWPVVLLGLYTFRLPVLYHYGRYLSPGLPAVLLLSCLGLAGLLASLPYRRLARAYVLLVIVAVAVLWVHGALRYARDVRWIAREHVAAAHWLATNTPAGTRVAAHDIGAIGYFSGRYVVDLAGIVAPEALRHQSDSQALAEHARARGAQYLAFLRGWYPLLARRLSAQVLWRSDGGRSGLPSPDELVIVALPP